MALGDLDIEVVGYTDRMHPPSACLGGAAEPGHRTAGGLAALQLAAAEVQGVSLRKRLDDLVATNLDDLDDLDDLDEVRWVR